MLLNLMLTWVLNQRMWRKRVGKHRTDNFNSVESQPEPCKEQNLDTVKRPIAYTWISIWGYFEAFVLIAVITMKTTDYPLNVFPDLIKKCDGVIDRLLALKLFSSVLLIVGCKSEITLLVMPWFVTNVLGIAPLWIVTISSFYKFDEFAQQFIVG